MKRNSRFSYNIFAEKNFIRNFILYFKSNIVPIILVISLAIVIIVPMFYSYFPAKLNLKEGDVSPHEIIANRDVSYIDVVKTEEQQERMAESVSPVYLLDRNKEDEVFAGVDDFFSSLTSILSSKDDEMLKREKLLDFFTNNTQIADFFLYEPIGRIEQFHQTLKGIVYKLMLAGVRSDKISQATQMGLEAIAELDLEEEEKELLIYALNRTIQPNLIYDKKATEREIEKVRNAVSPVVITISKGDVVVKEGEEITADEVKVLKALGVIRTRDDWKVVLSIFAFTCIFLLLSFIAIKRSVVVNPGNIVKKTAEFAIIVSIVYIVSIFLDNISPYLVPIPLLAMLVFAFFDFPTALTVTLAFSFLLSFPLDLRSPIMFAVIVSSIVSMFLLRKMAKTITFLYAGIVGGLSMSFIALFIGLSSKLVFKQVGLNVSFGFINFLGGSIVALGMIFVMDHLFNEATVLRLLELGDTGAPLLRELLTKAPGTYQHSMVVSNLASSAAEKIGANALLARVGAYYHDIGKMFHPYFFTENQQAIPNIHDELTPNLSKTVIINHVKDGIHLAKKSRLPQEIIDFIATHHGTTVVSYFYHKSKESNGAVRKSDFRYSGPLPQNKETAIVMLADAVEALAHTVSNPDFNKIEEMVNSIIKSRVSDGQLNESDITFKDLAEIKDSFVRTLLSLFHTRESYPESDESRNG
ncbi:MAG: HDIG domain-containing protein [Caldisericaceae bacterium]|nr:HDIG domain-containing protein [Caldisericaceae bacterium]